MHPQEPPNAPVTLSMPTNKTKTNQLQLRPLSHPTPNPRGTCGHAQFPLYLLLLSHPRCSSYPGLVSKPGEHEAFPPSGTGMSTLASWTVVLQSLICGSDQSHLLSGGTLFPLIKSSCEFRRLANMQKDNANYKGMKLDTSNKRKLGKSTNNVKLNNNS